MTVLHGLVNFGPTPGGRWRYRCICRDLFTADTPSAAADLFRDHLAETDAATGGGS